jgi:hypothetical protein
MAARIALGIVLLIAEISCKASSSPDRVALAYERQRVKGDVAHARGYLSASDEAELAAGHATSEDAGLRTVGVPDAVVDSARTLSTEGNGARVAVFMTAPNMEQAFAGLMRRAFTGESLDQKDAKAELRKVPRITVADTMRLVREDQGWRVTQGLAHRYALRDSVRPQLRIEKGYLGSNWIRGTVQNFSSARIGRVELEVFDSEGESHSADASDIAPLGTGKVLESASLAPGTPSRVDVKSVSLRD